MQHTVRVRMGAAHRDITAYAPYDLSRNRLSTTIDLRKLNKTEQRKAIFEVVQFVRIRRDQMLNN